MAHKLQWVVPTLCVLVIGLSIDVATASADNESGNSTHTNDFSKDNPIEQILEKIENVTDIEKKERTYIFKQNGEVIHEYVEDHQDIHNGRMEQVIEAWQARKRLLESLKEMAGNSGKDASDLIDPNLEVEINYQNLINDVKNEPGNDSFHDPDAEEAQSNGNNTGNASGSALRKRTMEKSESVRWPKGILPYVIKEQVRSNEDEYNRAMKTYEEKTCLRFVKWVNASTNEDLDLGHPGRINFVEGSGCWSYQGNMRWTDGQSISCCGGTTCVHELGHALGVAHEHQSAERDGWIRVNPENIWPDSRMWYNRFQDGAFLTFGYDLSSTMHYQSWGFSSGGPTMTLLFPELYIGASDYYMFMEIATTHKCYEMDPCTGFDMTCENDGYVSIVRGKCTCRCPTGLDPATGCTTPIKVQPGLAMPKGKYSLPKLKTGCPVDEQFTSGHATHVGDGRNYQSGRFSLEGVFHDKIATHHFCTHDVDDFQDDPDYPGRSDWPGGSYCILRKGGECPPDFLPGFVSYTDVESDDSAHSGDLPDGVYSNNKTRLEFCCQYNGFVHNPMVMPVDKPFVLYPAGGSCQEVEGMHVRVEEYGINAVDVKFKGKFHSWHNKDLDMLYNRYCVYEPADMECGGTITLDDSSPNTFVEINSTGRTDMECTWVVKGPNEQGTLVLEFDEFDIRQDGAKCIDSVEVRHARIGQKGLIYCGQDDWQSIRSITDKMMIRFKTAGADSNSHFKAFVRWVPNEEMCYNVEDRGVTYSGKVNNTRIFEPCLPWAEVTQCPHHPWNMGDELDNLEGNYCRNPDNSLRPWCYTALEGCKRNYCDVCLLEEPFNREENCEQLREEGFCTDDVTKATHGCACACNDLLPDPGPVQKFSDIRCGPPTPPMDATASEELKAEYILGEQVAYHCAERKTDVFTKTCMSNGEWSALGYICLECPINSQITNDSCNVLVDKKLDYYDAVTECENIGGQVAMIKSAEELEAIKKAAQGKQVWLGMTDLKTEGTFVWVDGTPVEFENWNDGEPNNWGNAEDCAVMLASGLWNDIYCSSGWSTSPVVCTVPKVGNIVCADFLEGKCASLLEAKPSMCIDYPSYAEEFCAKTCGVCGSESVTCSVAPASSHVQLVSNVTGSTINVGEWVTYGCQGDTYPGPGSLVRGCKNDGTLTGEEYTCLGLAESKIQIGLPVLEKKDVTIPPTVVFTAENELWTITHKGVITAWEFYTNSPMETAFMVWRVKEHEKTYELVGKNVITTGNDAIEKYEVPRDERINVEKGDIIGIWNSGKGGVAFNACDREMKPNWARISWSRKVSNVDDFKVGSEEGFLADFGCLELSFRAEVSLLV